MINLFDNYYIDKDNHNWMLQEKRIKSNGDNAGEEYFITIGFFPSILCLFKALPEMLIKKDIDDITSIDELISIFKKYEATISKECVGIKRKLIKADMAEEE